MMTVTVTFTITITFTVTVTVTVKVTVTVTVTVWCSGAVNKLSEVEERLRRTEDSSKENKSALSQLISHTQVQPEP